ncbi:uncharacterized protein LOC142542590 isoform X3 [Primulina tabacum]|uniref:uncharacterized protein LOC142542590 isoform X3 n=1 Tax=Primulina tabacum TaxID=48773 RepID=UPI003F59C41F
MAVPEFLLLPVVLFLSVYLAQSNALIGCQMSSCFSDRVAYELGEAKLRISRLVVTAESILEERIRDVNAKNKYFSERQRKIEELEVEIDRLRAVLSSFMVDSSNANQNLDVLDEEAQLLWAASRKNNFEIHELEYKAADAERRLREIVDQVEGMAEVVSEQWIQIQRLEQAVHMAEIRTSKLKRESGWMTCQMVKSSKILLGKWFNKLERILNPYAPAAGSMLVFFKSQALQLFSATKSYHHQLQGHVKQAMKSNEITAVLAHEELIFIVASVLVAFPIMSACMLLLSHFS